MKLVILPSGLGPEAKCEILPNSLGQWGKSVLDLRDLEVTTLTRSDGLVRISVQMKTIAPKTRFLCCCLLHLEE